MIRRNAFGEGFASSASEVLELLSELDYNTTDVYCPNIEPDGVGGWFGELSENESGNSVCYIESPDEGVIEGILDELQITY